MSQSELITSLTTALLAAKGQFPYASLRIWFEKGEPRFFLTNLPPRDKQKSTPRSATPVDAPKQSTPIQPPSAEVQPEASSRARGRPPRKRRNQNTTPSLSPEKLRSYSPYTQNNLNLSNLDHSRHDSFVNVPCHNSFQALADLGERNPADRRLNTCPNECSEPFARSPYCDECEHECPSCYACPCEDVWVCPA